MIPLACVRDPAYIWDPACNRDPASISTNYTDPWPVSRTQHLCGTRLLPKVLLFGIISTSEYTLYSISNQVPYAYAQLSSCRNTEYQVIVEVISWIRACLITEWKRLFQEGGCSVPVAVNTDIQGGKVCDTKYSSHCNTYYLISVQLFTVCLRRHRGGKNVRVVCTDVNLSQYNKTTLQC